MTDDVAVGRRRSLGAPSRLQFRVHPAGLAVLAGLLLAARVPALSPGNGPGFALVAALAAALILDGTWSLLVLRRGGLVVRAQAPADGQVGRPSPLQLEVSGRRAPLLVRISSVRSATWTRLDAPTTGEVMTVPERRGEFRALDVSLLHSAPLGLVGVQRTVLITLPTPILVGPRPIPTDDLTFPRGVTTDDQGIPTVGATDAELFRGARPYQPGDDPRRVHWPLTARSGELMVRELETLRRPAVVVVADLGPAPGEAAERAAGRAAGVAERALFAGLPVLLVTREAAGSTSAEVAGVTEVGRRLAVAVPGDPPVPPGGPVRSAAGPGRLVVVVDAEGARWQAAWPEGARPDRPAPGAGPR